MENNKIAKGLTYIPFSNESHKSMRERAKNIYGQEKALLFWNGKAHRMELYVFDENKFYTMDGKET